VLESARGSMTVVIATHEHRRAERLCDRLLHLEVLR
jgi:ABC-type multidrug transport system ATPase subunit